MICLSAVCLKPFLFCNYSWHDTSCTLPIRSVRCVQKLYKWRIHSGRVHWCGICTRNLVNRSITAKISTDWWCQLIHAVLSPVECHRLVNAEILHSDWIDTTRICWKRRYSKVGSIGEEDIQGSMYNRQEQQKRRCNNDVKSSARFSRLQKFPNWLTQQYFSQIG